MQLIRCTAKLMKELNQDPVANVELLRGIVEEGRYASLDTKVMTSYNEIILISYYASNVR